MPRSFGIATNCTRVKVIFLSCMSLLGVLPSTEMSSKGNCKESVLQYLINQNRPYSANDIMQNLHKEFGKTAIQKALDDLTVECKVREKSYGKQKVYSVIQQEDNEGEDVALEMVTLDSKIEEINEKLKNSEQKLKEVEGELKRLESEPSTEDAMEEKNNLEEEIVKLRKKIDTLSNSSLEITDEEKETISRNYENCKREQKKRKQICMDIINSIMENYPKKLKVLFEEIGIETDETA